MSEWECSPVELELLAEACRSLDELDALRRAVVKDGATVTGSRGQRRTHPALAELRQGRAELRRLLDALGIPQPLAAAAGGDGVVSLTSRRAQHAARARWSARA
jgi:Phage terminase, small subunit